MNIRIGISNVKILSFRIRIRIWNLVWISREVNMSRRVQPQPETGLVAADMPIIMNIQMHM